MSLRFSQFEERLYDRFGPVGGAVASFLLEIIQIILISSAIIIPIRYFLIQPFYVKGASMEPNFYDQEYLIIDELTYRFREPYRGEIVVFKYPRDPSQYFIKRVIGLPGETVEVTGGNVIIYNTEHPNGVVVEEDYLDESTTGKVRVTLGEDEYYVFGDNRDSSLDSRSFGSITRDDVIGRVWVRGLPLSRITTFDLPTYNL
ncbi:signal peptidase I [Candidatus Uhrbacteria bacterium]|nr:signal peptidase I [Candidatus Uhrbacteria bacterium]